MALLIYVTMPDKASAREMAHGLVDRGLAAGVNIIPGALSIYRWQGQVHEKEEVLLLAQTSERNWAPLESYVQEKHPYITPCIVGWIIEKGAGAFLAWIDENTGRINSCG